MNRKKEYLRILFAVFLISSTIAGCKKENVPPVSFRDTISHRTIRYTVLIVSGAGAGYKNLKQLSDTAYVSLVMNDSVYVKAASKSGLATFNNLAAGTAAVSVKCANHCTTNYIVDLSAEADTIEDRNNIRNVSTLIVLIPYAGEGSATISGKAFAKLDLSSLKSDPVPAGVTIQSIIEPSQYKNFVNHTGDGKIIAIAYENTINRTTTSTGGDYSFVVPATGSGMKIILSANDFVYNQQISPGVFERKIFRPINDTIKTYSGFRYVVDMNFK
jgi:hypothetical protein